MATKRKTTNSPAPAEPRKPKGTPRVRRAFPDSQLRASQVLRALASLGLDLDASVFERAYHSAGNRKKAKWNDPAAIRARLAELEGEPGLPSVTYPPTPAVNPFPHNAEETPAHAAE